MSQTQGVLRDTGEWKSHTMVLAEREWIPTVRTVEIETVTSVVTLRS